MFVKKYGGLIYCRSFRHDNRNRGGGDSIVCVFVKIFVVVLCFIGVTVADMLTQEEKDTLLSMHNAARKSLSVTTLTGESLPGASKMRELVWDDEIEIIAQQTANMCVYEHGDPDTEEYTLFYMKYGIPGQNLAGGTNVTSAFIHWYNLEARYWDPDTYECQSGKDCGHFKQILTDDIEKIGCGRPDPYYCDKNYLFCDFLPGLDTTATEPYTEGDDPCSSFESSYTIDRWLCLGCVDEQDPIECAKMKSENGGECSNDFEAMCNYTCGLCDGGEQYLPYLCHDDDDVDCDEYKTEGYCDSESEYYWMAMRDCRDTCDFKCECMDSSNRCSRFSADYCDTTSTFHAYMVLTCPDYCGFCEMELNLTYWSPTLAVSTTPTVPQTTTGPETTPPMTTSMPPLPPVTGCDLTKAVPYRIFLLSFLAMLVKFYILGQV